MGLGEDAPRGPTLSTAWQVQDGSDEGLDERGVQVHRSRGARSPGRVGPEPVGEGPPRGGRFESRDARLLKAAHHRAVEVALHDRLRRSDAVELGRAIRGEDEQRHIGEVRLGDGGVQLGGGRAAGDEDRDRSPRRKRAAKGEEPGASFVDPHVDR